LDFQVREAQGGSSLRFDLPGAANLLEGLFGKDAVVADLFDFQQWAVGLKHIQGNEAIQSLRKGERRCLK
jgi:hypothetical protein